jgi:membrane protein DedA with SNARE-associated domain
MHSTTALIAALAGKNLFETYFAFYLVTTILGGISAFASFWIVFEAGFGFIGFLCLIIVIFLAYETNDIAFYFLGRWIRDTRFGPWAEAHLPGYAKTEVAVRQRGVHWLLISKFIVGLATFVAIALGWSGMNFKKFYKNSILSTLLWLPILTILAYAIVSGLAPLAAANFEEIGWFVFGGFILFVILAYAVSSAVKLIEKCLLKANASEQ